MSRKGLKLFVYYPIVLAFVLCVGVLLGHVLQFGESHSSAILDLQRGSENGRRIGNLLDYINEEYVDTVNVDELTETAIYELINQLDPHSAYIPAKNLKTVNEPLEGNFDGIGVEFNIIEDTIVVLGVISGGPSEKLGIRSGDRIVTIESDTVAGTGYTSKNVVTSLRGERGTTVKVGIFRRGQNDLLYFNIKRDKVPIYSIDAAIMLNSEVGYMRISRFAATTFDEYEQHLTELKNTGMKSLVMDFRGNSGGYLKAAIAMADDFLPDDQLIVYTKRRDGRQNTHYATAKGGWEKKPIIFLIDEGSASASEILAGAIQDNDRGTVIGRRSFGKGLVQEQVILADGAAVRLTIARYYTPTGRCIQRPYEDREQYEMDVFHRYDSGELYNRDSIEVDENKQFTTKGGKIVYGGGGIIPDIFIPLDTTGNYRFHNALLAKGLIRDFALILSDRYRGKHANGGIAEFLESFTLTAGDRKELLKMAMEMDISIPDNQNSFPHAELELKARAARNLFNGEGYHSVKSRQDEMIKVAVEQLTAD